MSEKACLFRQAKPKAPPYGGASSAGVMKGDLGGSISQSERGCGVSASCHLSIQSVQALGVGPEEIEAAHQVGGGLLFLALLLDKPVQELQGAEVVVLPCFGIDVVDGCGDKSLVLQGSHQGLTEVLIDLVRCSDGSHLGVHIVVLQVVHEEQSVVTLFLCLDLEPVAEAVQVVVIVVIGHIQIEICGVELLGDLLFQQLGNVGI